MTRGSDPQRKLRAVWPPGDAVFDVLQVAVSEPTPGLLVVAPSGEVDVATSGLLRAAVLDAVGTGPRCVVVDLSGLTFCGSTGLVVLLECQAAATSAGIGFGVMGGPRIVRRVLEITGLGPLLCHRDTLDEVLAAQEY